jgi:hypothetical protein
LESVGDGYRMTEFQVFGAKAIACINGVTSALQVIKCTYTLFLVLR